MNWGHQIGVSGLESLYPSMNLTVFSLIGIEGSRVSYHLGPRDGFFLVGTGKVFSQRWCLSVLGSQRYGSRTTDVSSSLEFRTYVGGGRVGFGSEGSTVPVLI